jgi:hypothetical protein
MQIGQPKGFISNGRITLLERSETSFTLTK